jgi:hypothetical protein
LRNKNERIKLLENRETEIENLEDLLKQNPDTEKFYLHD